MTYLLGMIDTGDNTVNWEAAVHVRRGLPAQPARLLALLHEHWRVSRTWPSLTALGAQLGVGPTTVHHHLKVLQARGYVRRVSRGALQLVPDSVAYATDRPLDTTTSV